MSDRLHELWRVWQATHSREAEVALLTERLRLGELPLVQLDLAAFCGHAAARRVIEETGASPTPIPAEGWADELERGWGAKVRARYAELNSYSLTHEWNGRNPSDTGDVEPDLARDLERAARKTLAREALAPQPPE